MEGPQVKRSAILRRADPTARASVPVFKKCKACRQPFVKASAWQTYCRAESCAITAAEVMRLKREKAEAKAHRLKLADSKPLAHWLALTEKVVNHYILVRDARLTCISCGTGKTVQWEAGHYHSVGSHPELRFDPININKQCHRCNFDMGGNLAMYVIGLEAKWGKAERDRLDGPTSPAKFTREQLAEMRATYRAKTKELKT